MSFTPVPYGTFAPQTKTTVGTTAAQLPSVASREVWVQADDANTGSVFLGDSSVTSTGGGKVFTKLAKGAGVIIPVSNANLIYAVGTAAGQVFYVGVLDA